MPNQQHNPKTKLEPATLMEGEEQTARMGVRLDILEKIIEDLASRPELQEIFGSQVSSQLVIVADDSDLRIEEAGDIELTEQQREVFLEILGEVIRANAD